MDFQICVVCSLGRLPLLPLPIEHRQLFTAIVSPFITSSDLNACCLLLCKDCQLKMLSIHHFQKMALNGVRKLKYLPCNLNNASTTLLDDTKSKTSKQTTNGYKRPVLLKNRPVLLKNRPVLLKNTPVLLKNRPVLLENRPLLLKKRPVLLKTPQTTMGMIKTKPKKRSPEANIEFVPVLAPRDSNSMTGECRLKSQPDPMQVFPVLKPYLESDFDFECPEFEPVKTESNLKLEPESKLDAELPQCDSDNTEDCESANLEQNFRLHTQNRKTSEMQYIIIKSTKSKRTEKEPNTTAEKPKILNIARLANISKEVIIACIKDKENAAQEEANSTTEADAAAAAVAAKRERRRLNRKKPPKVQCPHCDKVISCKWDLRTHYHQVHAEKKPIKCDVCDKECRNDEALRIHKYTHNKRVEPKLFCKECSYQFASTATYNNHLRSLKHMPREHYKLECEVCKMKYPIESRLRVHMDSVHWGVRTFKCESCDKSYTENSKLRRHVRNAHEQRVRQKTYVCELCGKAFLVKKSLVDHLLVHQGLRPYKCKLCPADFSYRAGLYTHNQLKHLKKGKKKGDKNVEKN